MAVGKSIRLATLGSMLALGIALAAPDTGWADTPFRAPPPGFRTLALSFGGGTMTDVPKNTTTRNYAVQRAYADQISRQVRHPVLLGKATCIGDGKTPDRAIEISGLVRPEDEIGGGIACALARHPGARLARPIDTVLIVDDARTLLLVNLFDAAGRPVQVYTNAIKFAAAVPAP